MVDAAVRPSETPTAEPHIDAELVTRMLLGTWADTRREAREMIKDPAFWQINGLSMQEHRERVLSQLHLLVDAGGSRRAFPKKYGGLEDNGANLVDCDIWLENEKGEKTTPGSATIALPAR